MPQNARYTAASASTLQFLSVFFISTPAILFPGHFNAAFRCYLSHVSTQQFISDFNQITTSIIFILQTFLLLKYQGIKDQKDSPFSTHPIVMNVAVYSSTVHFFAYGAVLRFPLHRLAFIFRHLLVSSGYIAVATHLSIVLPDTAAPFVYAIFGLLSAAECLLWLHRKLDGVYDWIRRFFSNMFGSSENSHEQRMPRLHV